MAHWDEKLASLKAYKAKFGHTRIPLSEKEPEGFEGLRGWVRNVRQAVRDYKEDPSSVPFLDDAKVLDLYEDTDFYVGPKRKIYQGVVWDGNLFEEWKRYNDDEEIGPKPSKLQKWEKLIRDEYAKMKAGEDTVLTAPRIAVMTEQGFKFTTRKSKSMNEWINEWQEYREKHGKEPSRYVNYELGMWVKNQRSKYRLVKQGKGTKQMKNDVDRLTALGFPWGQCCKTGPKRTWDESYAMLLRYKERFGHTNVPQTYSKLGIWVASQRNEYKRFLKANNKAALITTEKLVKLNEIGFKFCAIELRG
jgi:hypothetical protein